MSSQFPGVGMRDCAIIAPAMDGSGAGDSKPRQGSVNRPGNEDSWRDLSSVPGQHAASSASAERSEANDSDANHVKQRLAGLRLFAVDGTEQRLQAVRTAIVPLGVVVEVGGPDEDGYRKALDFQPDVILSDLSSPGEPSWWLFQRFRRQLLLKWTPVLLMRWWKDDPSGGVHVLASRVVERIGEVLVPLRVIEERIAAGRALADRVEVTGIPALLKLLGSARLTGVLAVDDSWNTFEVFFDKGRLTAVSRRSVDGVTDSGVEAFLQVLLCDAGRWSFRSQESPSRANMRLDLNAGLRRAASVFASVFGPDAQIDSESDREFRTRPEAIRDVVSSLSGVGRQVVEAVVAGASPSQIDDLLSTPADLMSAERALITLIRCGAMRLLRSSIRNERQSTANQLEPALRHLLSKISEDHRISAADKADPQQYDTEKSAEERVSEGRGFYRVSEVMAERVALKASNRMDAIAPDLHTDVDKPEASGSESVKLDWEGDVSTPTAPDPAAMALNADHFSIGIHGYKGQSRVLPHDSLVPGPPSMAEDRGQRHMWLALALALLLGGLLVIGLIMIGGDEREPPAELPER